jgi:RDD family
MEPTYPSLLDRVQSIFIDAFFLFALTFAFAAILDKFESPPDWIRVALFFALWAIYEPLCTTLGCTLGQYVKRIRVKKYEDPARRIAFFPSFIRYILKTVLGWVSFLTISTNNERRAIHDFAAGSVMIRL